ncbi:MAG: SDR family NAD(P)-dependent oxidoreductase [Bacilli bacterium]
MKSYIAITGASQGIGEQIAYLYANKEYNLILIARNNEKLEIIKKKIEETYKVNVVILSLDLSFENNITKLIAELEKYNLYALINNAGFGYYHLVKEQDIEKVKKMIDLNVKAVTLLSTYFVNKYIETKTKRVLINVSSSGGYINVPNAVTYCATKFFVSSFTEGLALELKNIDSKLEVKVVAPSVTKTSFGSVASGISNYEYEKIFTKFNTAEEIALMTDELIDSDKIVAYVNRDSYEFEFTDNKFDYDDTRLKTENNANN